MNPPKTIDAWLLLFDKEDGIEISHVFYGKPEYYDLVDVVCGVLRDTNQKGYVAHLLLMNGKTHDVSVSDNGGDYVMGAFHLKQQTITLDV
jgi:hypothetical protein